jgi:uncharacterized YigZ family protein
MGGIPDDDGPGTEPARACRHTTSEHPRYAVPTIRTLTGEAELEIDKIKGSRFLGVAVPAPTEDDCRAALEAVRARFPDASHHCWAWRGQDAHRSSDDGEPNGTAGAPILQRIDGAELADVLVVVMRWWGGTKLGKGGLIRAYGEAAAAVLGVAPIETQRVRRVVTLRCRYDQQGVVKSLLGPYEAEQLDAAYDSDVQLRLALPVEHVEGFVAEVRERTSGKVVPQLA